jgi:hypothetical protein
MAPKSRRCRFGMSRWSTDEISELAGMRRSLSCPLRPARRPDEGVAEGNSARGRWRICRPPRRNCAVSGKPSAPLAAKVSARRPRRRSGAALSASLVRPAAIGAVRLGQPHRRRLKGRKFDGARRRLLARQKTSVILDETEVASARRAGPKRSATSAPQRRTRRRPTTVGHAMTATLSRVWPFCVAALKLRADRISEPTAAPAGLAAGAAVGPPQALPPTVDRLAVCMA